MANINTLKALYQPISSAATKNVLADVSNTTSHILWVKLPLLTSKVWVFGDSTAENINSIPSPSAEFVCQSKLSFLI